MDSKNSSFKKTIFFMAFMLGYLMTNQVHADIVAATRWVNDKGNEVYLYYDNHNQKAPAQWSHINEAIFKMPSRKKRLDILVEI